jgi:FixJ family two-component response regulator
MPGMSGLELQEELAAQKQSIPIVVITGERDPDLLARVRAAGVLDLLPKPFNDDDLKDAIERALGGDSRGLGTS